MQWKSVVLFVHELVDTSKSKNLLLTLSHGVAVHVLSFIFYYTNIAMTREMLKD